VGKNSINTESTVYYLQKVDTEKIGNLYLIIHYTRLSPYASSLKDAGIDVTYALVYYPVLGVIHELIKKPWSKTPLLYIFKIVFSIFAPSF
jgi:hypothetical protein